VAARPGGDGRGTDPRTLAAGAVGRVGVAAERHVADLREQALRQLQLQLLEELLSVRTRDLHLERREGAGDRAGGAGGETGGEPTGAGAAIDVELRLEVDDMPTPRGELGVDRLLTTGRRHRQRRPRTLL